MSAFRKLFQQALPAACALAALLIGPSAWAETVPPGRIEAIVSQLQKAGELSGEDAASYREGSRDAADIVLKTGETLGSQIERRKGSPVFEMVWGTTTAGGGSSDEERFAITGSSGALAAGTSSGSGFEVSSGLPVAEGAGIFADGFESGDLCSWSSGGC